MLKLWRRFYRATYRVNRMTYTARAVTSRRPVRRTARLEGRRLAYKGFARVMRRLLK